MVILSIIVSAIKTPTFIEHKELEKEVISILPSVEGKYLMIGNSGVTSYTKAYYSYAAIYHNISTVSGWYNQIASPEYIDTFRKINNDYSNGRCEDFNKNLEILGVEEVIFYGYECDKLNSCGLNEKASKGKVCLYRINAN